MTVVTGIVDAVSYLKLGHVFVANMTGNVVFLGFAAAGSPGIDPIASVLAILAFLIGARLGNMPIARAGSDRVKTVALVTIAQASMFALAIALAAAFPIVEGALARYVLAIVLAIAMGAQNAVAKKLAVPDLTTTVLTMTITALGSGMPGNPRRFAAIAAMFGGAAIGGVIVLRFGIVYALGLAFSIACAVALFALIDVRARRGEP